MSNVNLKVARKFAEILEALTENGMKYKDVVIVGHSLGVLLCFKYFFFLFGKYSYLIVLF